MIGVIVDVDHVRDFEVLGARDLAIHVDVPTWIHNDSLSVVANRQETHPRSRWSTCLKNNHDPFAGNLY